jgi:hypothetical protein
VALVAHQPGESQAGRRQHLARQVKRRLSGRNTASSVPDVQLDHDAQLHLLRRGGRAQRGDVARIVHGHDHVGVRGQVDEAGDLAGADHFVGDQDVPDARLCHDLGFAQLSARDADGACVQLHPRQHGGLVRLAGGRSFTGRSRVVRHAPDVALHRLDLEAQCRCVQLRLR